MIEDVPRAHSAAPMRAMPARMSGETIGAARSSVGPTTTARCGSHRMIRAPIAMRLSTKKRRLSNSFSWMSRGTVLIHEKLFESRLFFVDSLIAMGARIILCDPHRAVVVGPTELRAAPMVSPDIRAGMALIGAALCARGTSSIMNAHQVDRGYERIDERLRSLGARITREPGA